MPAPPRRDRPSMPRADRAVLSRRPHTLHGHPTMTSPALLNRLGAALLATTPLATAAAQQPSFTIESALSAPFPSGLTAAPAGGRIAWIFDAEGSRNIWIAEPSANGSFTSRQLTRLPG